MTRPSGCAGLIWITGAPAAGKSHLLSEWIQKLQKKWQLCGYTTLQDSARTPDSNTTAKDYHIRVLGSSRVLPWALQKPGTDEPCCPGAREFPESTLRHVMKQVLPALDQSDLCVLEDIGPLELSGEGFGELLDRALSTRDLWVVVSAKKNSLPALRERFATDGMTLVVDLDEKPETDEIRSFLEKELASRLASRIGVCSGLGGLVEVGLGSFLHSFRVPLKGHTLAYIQTLLMVTFGKSLRGRGLFRIAALMGMLKAFSPAGRTIRPMMYIFLQGSIFTVPVWLLGWHLLSVILGSILLNGLTLFLSLFVKYLMFGKSIVTALGNLISTVTDLFGLELDSWLHGILFLFGLKAGIAVLVAVAAWYFHLAPWFLSMGRRAGRFLRPKKTDTGPVTGWRSVRLALRDVFRPMFLLAFLFSLLVIFFFANLTRGELVFLLIRGLTVAFVGFWLFRRINVVQVSDKLRKKFKGDMAVSLIEAMRVLQEESPPVPAPTPEP